MKAVDLSELAHSAGAWRCELDAGPLSGRTDWLDADELDRMRRFRFSRDARRFATSRMLVRGLMGAAVSVAPRDVRWSPGSFGKPHVLDADEICFNVSHSGDHLLLALSPKRPIGVDIEAATTLGGDDFTELAARCFTSAEQTEFHALDQTERRTAFLRCWTRKEACLKALGSGLSIEPSTFEVGFRPAIANVHIAVGMEDCAITVASVPVVPGVEGAVALLADASRHLAF